MWEAWAPVVVQIIFMLVVVVVFVVRLESSVKILAAEMKGQVKLLSKELRRVAKSVLTLSQGLGRLSERVTQIERDDARKGS